jgi:hypothetical protein
MFLPRSILALIAALALGCSSSSAPNTQAPHTTGTFTLVSADAQPLPALVFDGTIVTSEIPPFHLRILAKAGTFTIDANGHYEHRVLHDAFIDGVIGARPDHSDHGECTRSGAELHCVSTYLEFVEFTATQSEDAITIAQDLIGEGRLATYRYQWTSGV